MSTTANGPGEGTGARAGESESEAPTAERLAEHAHRMVDGAAAGAAEAERKLRRAAAAGHERTGDADEQIAALDQNLRKLRTYIENNPIQSAGIAFAAGVVLSSLLRR